MKTDLWKAFFSHPLTALLLLLVTPVGFYHWTQHSRQKHDEALAAPVPGAQGSMTGEAAAHDPNNHMIHAPGVRAEVFHPATVAGVRDMDQVIGVTVRGKPRAYLVEAMSDPRHCVVNDVVGGRPLSILCGYESDSFRVLTVQRRHLPTEDAAAPAPLELGIACFSEGLLFITYRGRMHFSGDELDSLVDFPYSLCSWGAWKDAYPDTDLYVGNLELRGGRRLQAF